MTIGDMEPVVYCKTCGLFQRVTTLAPGERAHCARCDSVVQRHRPDSINRTIALALAALIFYVPANIYPIIEVKAFGIYAVDFVWTGTAALWGTGFQSVAVLVFLMSMVVPLIKILALLTLASIVLMPVPAHGTRVMQRVHEILTDWWMVDVLLLAGLVSLIRMAQLADASAGPGLYAVGALMILTISATLSFDTNLLWTDRRASH